MIHTHNKNKTRTKERMFYKLKTVNDQMHQYALTTQPIHRATTKAY